MTEDEKNIYRRYFSNPFRSGQYEIKSPYISALIDSRIATGRNKKNGKKLNKSHGSWIGALGYMILLDHVGKIVKIKNEKDQKLNPFLKSLYNFSDLNKQQIYALYSLRCAFAHDYSLFNIPKRDDKEKELKCHWFSVSQGENDRFITFPSKRWDGNFENAKSVTTINLEKLCDLVELINKKIKEKIENNDDSLHIEIKKLFFIMYKF